MKRVEANQHALHMLCSCNKKVKIAILETANPELIKSIIESVLNVMNGNVPLSKLNRKKVRKHMKNLRKITDPSASYASKKNIIVQRGGFLIPILTSVLAALVGRLISKS